MSVPSYLIEPLSIIWRNGPVSDPSLLTKAPPSFVTPLHPGKAGALEAQKAARKQLKKALNSEA